MKITSRPRFADHSVYIGLSLVFILTMVTFSMKSYQPVVIKHVFFFVGVVLTGIAVLVNSAQRQGLPDFSVWYLPFFLYFGLQILSGFYSDFPMLSQEPMFAALALFIYFLIILSADITSRHLQWFLSLIWFVSLVTGVYGFVQFFGLDPVMWKGFEGRVFSTFGHPNFYACYLLFSIPIILLSLFTMTSLRLKVLGGIILLLCWSNLMLTRSRSAWIALVFAFIPFLFLKRMYHYLNKGMTQYIVLGLIIVIAAFSIITHPEIGERVLSIFDAEDHSIKSRLIIYQTLLPGILSDPVLGKGIGTFSAIFPMYHTPELYEIPPFTVATMLHHAHSEYLEIVLDTGFLGLLLFITCLVLSVVFFKKLYRQETDADLAVSMGVFIGLLAMLIQDTAGVGFRFLTTQALFWGGLGLIISRARVVSPTGLILCKTPVQKVAVSVLFAVLLATMALTGVPYIIKSYQAEILLLDAQKYNKSGKFVEAIKAITGSIDKKPHSIDALTTLGFSYIQTNRYTEAEKVFNKVLDINPHYPLTHYYLALVKFLQHDLAKAREYLDEAQKWRPRSWEIEELYGKICHDLGQFDAARQHYLRAIDISSTETTQSYFNLGEMAYRTQDYETMFYYFSKSLNTDPTQVEILQKVKKVNTLIRKQVPEFLEAEVEKDPSPLAKNDFKINYMLTSLDMFDTITPSLTSGVVIKQTFEVTTPSIQRVSVRVATHQKKISYTFQFRLFELVNNQPKLVHESTRFFQNLSDSELITFSFDEISATLNKVFRAEFSAADTGSGPDVHLWMMLRDHYYIGEVFIDDLGIGSDLNLIVR